MAMKNEIGPKIFDLGGNMTGGTDPQAIADAMEMGGYWPSVEAVALYKPDGTTENVPYSKFVGIWAEEEGNPLGKCWDVKDWNAMAVEKEFDLDAMPKTKGLWFKLAGNYFGLTWPYQGVMYGPTGAKIAGNTFTNFLAHSIYEMTLPSSTASQNGTDYAMTQNTIPHGTAGGKKSDAWSTVVDTENDTITLVSSNTGQQWNCKASSLRFYNAMQYDDNEAVTHALWCYNEWMRHRFAICSGVATSEPDGTTASVDILTSSGEDPVAGDDMYFWIDGSNTGLLAKYNLNNRHATNSAYLTETIRDYLYDEQKTYGENINSENISPVFMKGAEVIAVDGYWYIITPYISRPMGNNEAGDYNITDSPSVYYAKNTGIQLLNERNLYSYWTTKTAIITPLINYLRNTEGRTVEVPAVLSSFVWAATRNTANNAWYVNAGSGNLYTTSTNNRYAVVGSVAFEDA